MNSIRLCSKCKFPFHSLDNDGFDLLLNDMSDNISTTYDKCLNYNDCSSSHNNVNTNVESLISLIDQLWRIHVKNVLKMLL